MKVARGLHADRIDGCGRHPRKLGDYGVLQVHWQGPIERSVHRTEGLKIDVLEYRHQNGAWPVIGDAGVSLAINVASYAGKYLTSAEVSTVNGNCVITAHMPSNTIAIPLRGKQLVFTMDRASKGPAHWNCSSDMATEYLRQTCR